MKIMEDSSQETLVAASLPLARRPLLLPERTMLGEGRHLFCSLFTIKLLGNLQEAQLRQALNRVQHKHPLLRCVIEEGPLNRRPYFVLQHLPEPISLRVVERQSDNDWQNEVRREWATPFAVSRGPLVRLVWLRSKSVHEWLLIGHHSICDGQSGMTLLRDLLAAYDRPEQDLGAYHALGTLEERVPLDRLRSARFQRRVRLKASMLRSVFFLKQCLVRKRLAPPISPEHMYFHRWCLDQRSAQALMGRSRAEGVTVLAAVSLAFMQSFRDVRGQQALCKTYAMVNARRFMRVLPPDSLCGIVPGIKLCMKNLPPPHEMAAEHFWARARAIKKNMTRRLMHLAANMCTYLVALERLHDKLVQLVAETENALPVRHLTLSNMGKIGLPQQYQNFRLESVYSPLVMVSPTPANTVVLSSFAGQIEFAIISDEVSLPFAQALAIQQRTMAILEACVKLPLQNKTTLSNKDIAR